MYYVMDLVLGTTVHALMQQQRFKYVKEEWGQHFALQTLEALKYMHVRGFVHRCGTSQHALSSNKMAPITSDCGEMRYLSTKWP